jgi:hypothetical protein
MARNGKYGKDNPERFIDEALDGGGAPGHDGEEGFQDSLTSNEIERIPADRRGQEIQRAYAMDNVGRVYDRFPTSMKHDFANIHGSVDNLKHSLTGTSAVNEEVGAAGPVKHIIIPNH